MAEKAYEVYLEHKEKVNWHLMDGDAIQLNATLTIGGLHGKVISTQALVITVLGEVREKEEGRRLKGGEE